MKKKTFIKNTVLILLLIISKSNFAQSFNEAIHSFNFNLPFSVLRQKMQTYYASVPRIKGSGYKQWKRFEWWANQHLNPDGTYGSVLERNKIAEPFTKSLSALQSSTGNWNVVGPTWNQGAGTGNGRSNCIAFNPNNSNQIYVGCPNGGLWMGNINAAGTAATWTPLTDGWLTSGVSSIVIQQDNPNIIYVLTGDGNRNDSYSIGLLKSTDGGYSWQPTGLKFTQADQQFGYKIIQNPQRPGTLFVTTNQGIYYSYDAGQNFTPATRYDLYGNILNVEGCCDMEYMPGDTTKMVGSRIGSCVYSSNGGRLWTDVAFLASDKNFKRMQLGVSPNAPAGTVWLYNGVRDSVMVNGTWQSAYKGMYKSTDYGHSYHLLNKTPNISGYNYDGSDRDREQHIIDMDIAVNPFNANIILAGTENVWRSTNGGNSFGTNATSYWQSGGTLYIHEDINFITYNPYDGIAYCGSDGGVYRSTDNGTTWNDITKGLVISQFYRIGTSPINADIIVNGAQDAAGNVRVGNTSEFKEVNGGDGMSCMIDNLNPSVLYTSYADDVFRSDNGGSNIVNIRPKINNVFVGGNWVTAIGMDYNAPNYIYYGASNPDDIFRSDNRGSTWVNIGGAGQTDIAICPNNSDRMYSLSGVTIFRIDNVKASNAANVVWTAISKAAGTGWPQTPDISITRLGVNPSNSADIWFVIGGYIDGVKVYRSTDAGVSWQNMSGSLPNIAILSIAVDNTASGEVYIGTDAGVFYRNDNIGSWKPFRNGLPVVPVTDLKINHNGSKLRAATYGRGIWESDLNSGCLSSQYVTGSQPGYKFYETSDYITSDAVSDKGLGSQLNLKAANKVTLSNGFFIKSGSQLKTWIGPCGAYLPGMQKVQITNIAPAAVQPEKLIEKQSTTNKIKKTNTH